MCVFFITQNIQCTKFCHTIPKKTTFFKKNHKKRYQFFVFFGILLYIIRFGFLEDFMDYLIISDFYNNQTLAFLKKDNSIINVFDLSENSVSNIYVGLIKDKIDNLRSVFVEFADTKGFCKLSKEEFSHVKTGDKLLVQVKTEPKGEKLHTLTTEISFTGKYVVIFPNETFTKISSKINDTDKRDILKQLGDKINAGVIFRTNSEDANLESIKEEIDYYLNKFKSIYNKFEHISAKECVYKSDRLMSICNNLNDETTIVTDTKEIYQYLIANSVNVVLYENKDVSLQNKYALGKVIKEAKSKNIWLKSGAYIVIETTEALTSIDVNSGKNSSSKNVEENHYMINKEAIGEILHQVKLRNISGIIIIDFINMTKQYQKSICEELKKQARSDSLVKVVGFTRLGLMEMTRKKQDKTLMEILETK